MGEPATTLSHADWLEMRRRYLGGSDAAAALGMSRWTTRRELYLEKRGEYQQAPNEAMRRGIVLEPLVAELYRRQTDHTITDGGWIVSDEHEWMAATPDRLDHTADCLVQLKTASTWGRAAWGDDRTPTTPDDYVIQCQHEMAVTGARENVLCVLFADQSTFRALVWMASAGYPVHKLAEFAAELIADPESPCELLLRPIRRDEETIAMIVEGERLFWQRHVQAGVSPPDETIPPASSDILEADERQRELLGRLREAKRAENLAAEAYRDLVEPVKTEIGEASGIRAEGICSITYRSGPDRVTTHYEDAVNYARLWEIPSTSTSQAAVRGLIARHTTPQVDWQAVWQGLDLTDQARARILETYTTTTHGTRVFRPRFLKD
jgi:putative phage-type endonuclease